MGLDTHTMHCNRTYMNIIGRYTACRYAGYRYTLHTDMDQPTQQLDNTLNNNKES